MLELLTIKVLKQIIASKQPDWRLLNHPNNFGPVSQRRTAKFIAVQNWEKGKYLKLKKTWDMGQILGGNGNWQTETIFSS